MKDEILKLSKQFWNAMDNSDETMMRANADENCNFVHIGITCKLDQEIKFYTDGTFKPTELIINRPGC